VTLHFPDAEAAQVRPTAHLLMNPILRTTRKMSRLLSANVAERALVLTLKMEFDTCVQQETMKTDLQENI
jgi:hypothetical protein